MRTALIAISAAAILALGAGGCASSGGNRAAPRAGAASSTSKASRVASASQPAAASAASYASATSSAGVASAAVIAAPAPTALQAGAWNVPGTAIGKTFLGGWVTSSAPTGTIYMNPRGVRANVAPMTGRIGPPTQ